MVTVWGTGVLGLQHIFCWGHSSTYTWVLGLGFDALFLYAYRTGRISWCCLPQLPPSLGDCTIGCHSGKVCLHWAECLASVIPALSRLRQKDSEFQVWVGHIVDSLLNNNIKANSQKPAQCQLLKMSPRCHKRLGCFPLSKYVWRLRKTGRCPKGSLGSWYNFFLSCCVFVPTVLLGSSWDKICYKPN